MHFIKPTKRKLATTMLFIVIGLIFSATDHLASKAYKEYIKITHFEGELLDEYESIIKQGPITPPIQDNRIRELVKKITPEAHRKVEIAGKFYILMLVVFGVFITYLGACFVHRVPKSCNAT